MKRLLHAICILLCVVLLFLCSGCSSFLNGKLVERPADTNLEFWITENVDNVDFSEHTPRYGLMGGREYYGKGYVPTTDENGQQIPPDEYVVYTITSYPDYSSEGKHVTGISITDPDVTFYGLTVCSTLEEFEARMTELGYEVIDWRENVLKAVKGNISFFFNIENPEHRYVRIEADVENMWGLVF